MSSLRTPQGFKTLTANLGIKDDTPDFSVVYSEVPASAAGVYTQSRFAGPSVVLSRAVTATGIAQAVAVISKNANVANGAEGTADAERFQHLVALSLGCNPADVAIASTGVIGRRYPMDKIELGLAGLPSPDRFGCDFEAVATAIMTTDTHAKCASRQLNGSRGQVALMGIAKGVGMIEPNMATLLAYFYTDAEIAPAALDEVFKSVMDRTFNALSIDTDTSTSDSAMILANGLGGEVDRAEFEQALYEVALELVLQIAADGEGASKVIEVTVEGARDDAQARRVAKSVVNSPLVKTAVHGADPNWGRIAMAVGKCHEETDIEADSVVIRIGGQEMYPTPVDSAGLAAASAHMAGSHVLIEVDLHIADGRFTAYGCDLTDGYVRINADYTT